MVTAIAVNLSLLLPVRGILTSGKGIDFRSMEIFILEF
jgi:hypothetical protein